MLEEKIIYKKKIGFWGQNIEPVEALSQPTQPARILVDPFPLPDGGQVEECKNTFSLPIVFPSWSRYPPSRSIFGRGLVEATVICQSIKCSNG